MEDDFDRREEWTDEEWDEYISRRFQAEAVEIPESYYKRIEEVPANLPDDDGPRRRRRKKRIRIALLATGGLAALAGALWAVKRLL